MHFNVGALLKHGESGAARYLQTIHGSIWKNHWTAAFNKQHDITRLVGGTFDGHANAAVSDEQLSQQMIDSLDNLAMAAVQKNNTVGKLVIANKQVTDTVAKLQAEDAKLLQIIQTSITRGGHHATRKGTMGSDSPAWESEGYCWSHRYKCKIGHNSKTCNRRLPKCQEGATQKNMMGGSELSKYWKPK